MLTCREVAAKASSMVDDELSFREIAVVKLHLMMCVNCRRLTRQFKALVSSMASHQRSETEDISPDFVNVVMERLDSVLD